MNSVSSSALLGLGRKIAVEIEIAQRYPDDVHIVYPVHLNPNVQVPVYRLLAGIPNITLLPPLEYLPLVYLMKHSALVLTDPSGIQEEAPSLGEPVLVLRAKTERPEDLEAGTVKLVGIDQARMVTETVRRPEDGEEYQRTARAANPYVNGHAAERIVRAVLGETVTPFKPGESDHANW